MSNVYLLFLEFAVPDSFIPIEPSLLRSFNKGTHYLFSISTLEPPSLFRNFSDSKDTVGCEQGWDQLCLVLLSIRFLTLLPSMDPSFLLLSNVFFSAETQKDNFQFSYFISITRFVFLAFYVLFWLSALVYYGCIKKT